MAHIDCLRDESIADFEEDCPQVDTTFVDCFKITSYNEYDYDGFWR